MERVELHPHGFHDEAIVLRGHLRTAARPRRPSSPSASRPARACPPRARAWPDRDAWPAGWRRRRRRCRRAAAGRRGPSWRRRSRAPRRRPRVLSRAPPPHRGDDSARRRGCPGRRSRRCGRFRGRPSAASECSGAAHSPAPGFAAVESAPALAQRPRRRLRLAIAREDALLVAVDPVQPVVGGEVGEVPDVLADELREAVEDAVVGLEVGDLVLLGPDPVLPDGVQAWLGVGAVLAHHDGLARPGRSSPGCRPAGTPAATSSSPPAMYQP